MLSWDKIQSNAVSFSSKWIDAHKKKKIKAKVFLKDFLHVFGVEDPEKNGHFKYKVKLSLDNIDYIDFLLIGQIGIKMKSPKMSLNETFEQLKNYMSHLPKKVIPDLWMVCDLKRIILYIRSTKEVYNFQVKDLQKHIKKFALIAEYSTENNQEDPIEVNIKAAEKIEKLQDALKTSGLEKQYLDIYLIRLLFCMFADDTGIFQKDSLYNYINKSDENLCLSKRIDELFLVLNMPDEIRTKNTLLSEELKQFRYINGNIFKESLPKADFDNKIKKTLLECINFDWYKISPAIFCAMFQEVLDNNKRRELNAHNKSEENILKLLNPLFLDELWIEFEKIKSDTKALDRFHDKIASLKFLDPACGCGNFLIIAYRELRLLEHEVLKMKTADKKPNFDITPLIKVNVEQFFGIEYEEFPCLIAQLGMWLTDHQMNQIVSEHFDCNFNRLPLTQSAKIVHGNALKMEWKEVVSKTELSYILGNPPFVGSRYLSLEQRKEISEIFLENKTMDYVCAWFKKAAEYMFNTRIRSAFVSINTITLGEQVPLLWKSLIEKGIYINFGVPTFKWKNEGKRNVAVNCVIIGFSYIKTATNLNPYLSEKPVIFVENRKIPLCSVPPIRKGNIFADGQYLVLDAHEYEDFISKEPTAKQYIKRLIGAEEFISNVPRYCLWLKKCSPSDTRKMPLVMEKIEKVRKWRLSSSDEAARKIAGTPTLFREMINPDSFIAIPIISSEKSDYIPMLFMDSETIATNTVLIIPEATLYHFGILTSSVHMAWMRAVCGRPGMSYRYSKCIIYNNFPWPTTTVNPGVIESLAQNILTVRTLYPQSCLVELYDPKTMPIELLKAHQELDKAVLKLYGINQKDFSEEEIVEMLIERYIELIKN